MKYKNYAFWTSLAAALVILANSIAKALGVNFDSQLITDIVMAVCGLLIVLGIVSMPKELTDKTDLEELGSDENDNDLNNENDNDK